jgi:adhesin/invasin
MRDFVRTSSALCALLLAVSCGGDDLVLPEDGVPSAIDAIGGNDQNGTIGAPLADPLVARVLDAAGRPVQGQQVTFSVLSGGGSVAPLTANTGADGQASTVWTLGAAAGAQQVHAKATGGAAPANLLVLFNATAGASAAANLTEVSGGGQTATAGSTLADSLIVRVTDAASNPVAGVAVTWTASGEKGSVSAATTTTGADGRTGVRHTLDVVAGAQSAVATSAGLTGSPVTFAATATVGSAGRLAIDRQPSAATASGAAFAVQPRIQMQDGNGNNVGIAGRAITAELIGPSPSTLNGGSTVSTDPTGLATFTNLGITGPSGSYTLNFTGTDLTGVTSNPITVVAGAATKLGIATPPSASVQSGVQFPQQPVIQLQDGSGNPVAGAGIMVNAVLQGGGGAVLGGDLSVPTNSAGTATFTDLRITGNLSNRTILFASAGLTSVTSPTITVTPGPVSGANSTLGADPVSFTAGDAAGSTITVTARDASGNPVPGASVTPSSTGGGAFDPTSTTTNGSGAAVFTYTNTVAGSKTISAVADGVALAQPVPVTVDPAAPSASKSSLELSPATIVADGTGSTVTVTARDQFDNIVPGAAVTIDATGTNSGVPAAGIADANGVFSTVVTSSEAGDKTVTATVGGVALPVQTLTVEPGPGAVSASLSSVTAESPRFLALPSAVTVTVRDAGGAALAGLPVTLADGGAGGVFIQPLLPTSAAGEATGSYSHLTAGSYTITASVGSVVIDQQALIVVEGL